MQRIFFPVIAGSLFAIAAPAWSQQYQQGPPLGEPQASSQAGVGPQIKQPQAVQPAVVPSNPAQRPQSSSPIKSTGPARTLPAEPEPTRPLVSPARPAPHEPVLDAAGKPVHGLIQVSPNRAYDPATGRYYWTTPATR